MEVDDALKHLGPYGYFQLRIFIQISLMTMFAAWHSFCVSFIAVIPEYRCAIPEGAVVKDVIPVDDEGMMDSCAMRQQQGNGSNVTVPCKDGWWFSLDNDASIVVEWNLVCDKKTLVQLAASVYFAGRVFGALCAPVLSDIFGRKKVIIICYWMWAILGTATAFVHDYRLYAAIRAIIAALDAGASLSSYCLLCEYFPTKQRAFVGNAVYFFWCIGMMSLPGISYLVPQWRNLQLIISVPMFLSIAFWWTLPESLHWMITHGKEKECEELLKKAARLNNVSTTSSSIIVNKPPDDSCCNVKKKTLLDVFRTPNLRFHALLVSLTWAINGMVYYGLSLGTYTLAGNKHLNFFLSGLVEIPAYLACVIFLKRFGRKKPTCIFHILAGLPLIVIAVMPAKTASGADLSLFVTVLTMVGKFAITASFSAIYLMASEVYPTVVRNAGLGLSCLSARIGSVIAPYTVYLRDVSPVLQSVIFAGVSFIAAGVIMVLPETANRNLPETLDDASGQTSEDKKSTEMSVGSDENGKSDIEKIAMCNGNVKTPVGENAPFLTGNQKFHEDGYLANNGHTVQI